MDEHYTYPDSADTDKADDTAEMAKTREILEAGCESLEWTASSIRYAIKRGHFTGAKVLLELATREVRAVEKLLTKYARQSRNHKSAL